VWFEPDARVKVGGKIERQPRVFVSHVRTPRLRKETPVLALDGTGSIDLNRRIFGEHMAGEWFAVPRDAEVWQVTSKTFSRQSITGTDRRGQSDQPEDGARGCQAAPTGARAAEDAARRCPARDLQGRRGNATPRSAATRRLYTLRRVARAEQL
jgi:hypothetical protein